MTTLLLTQNEIRELLPMKDCVDEMAKALEALGRGDGQNPLRRALVLPDRGGLIGMMPAYLGTPEAFGLKVVAVMPGSKGTELDSHQGVVMLFDTTTGAPIVILDASEVTSIRTAAVSGLATRLLAKEDAGDLAILGSGVQARTHLAAMRVARDLRRVRVYSPERSRLEEFATRESERYGIRVEAASSAEEAVRDADLICTTTSSDDPVLFADWVAPGAHINAAGSSVKYTRELDTATVVRSRLFVDRRESTLNEAGDFLIPKKEGAVDDDHIVGELGEILLGQIQGRESADEITLFKSLGLGIEDVATAHFVLQRARERGMGTSIDFGGLKV